MTTFTIDFDFTGADQRAILQELQSGGYNLVAFKGAAGPSQVTTGVPVWFVSSFVDMIGKAEIEYEPQYCVFVDGRQTIAAQTTLDYSNMSAPVDLGTGLTMDSTGAFTVGGISGVPKGSIGLFNGRAATTKPVTVGLAGLVQGQYLPFCAFTLAPQGSIIMTPLEQVLLMAAQLEVQSGNVQATLTAPGCMFEFTSQSTDFRLAIEPGDFAITSAPGGLPVTPVSSTSSVSQVNQIPSNRNAEARGSAAGQEGQAREPARGRRGSGLRVF